MDITFNYQNWLSRYFAWVFGVNPPNWLCPFFWLIIFLVVLSPVIVIVKGLILFFNKMPARSKKRADYLQNETTEQYTRRKQKEQTFMKIAGIVGKVLFGCLIAFYAGIILYGLYLSIMAYDLHDWLMGAVTIIGVIVLFGGAIFGIGWALVKGVTSYPVRNAANTVGHLIGMAYHTVCPHITWIGTPPIKPRLYDGEYESGYSDAEDAGA